MEFPSGLLRHGFWPDTRLTLIPRIPPCPNHERQLQGQPHPKHPNRNSRKRLRMQTHVDMHRQECRQHQDNPPSGKLPYAQSRTLKHQPIRHQDPNPTQNLRHPAPKDHRAGPRNIRRHHRPIKLWQHQMVHPSHHVKEPHHRQPHPIPLRTPPPQTSSHHPHPHRLKIIATSTAMPPNWPI